MAPQIRENNILDNKTDSSLGIGHHLANAPKGDEVIISGMAGDFPECQNVKQLKENLFNKVDLISGDERRWAPFHSEIPLRSGKLIDLQNYDPGFFGNHSLQADHMDPLVRLFLERSVEAIYDAGVNPKDLENTKTGVFVGACASEFEISTMYDASNTYAVTGCVRSMIPNRLSYFLKLKGPSIVIDTACSSSSYALAHAYKSIRTGECDQAIVGGTNICCHPYITLQFARLGVLSKDGKCKSFDEAANGYARSEAVVAVFLQKAKDAKRIYAQIVHAKLNSDGYKEEGITFPSRTMQETLVKEFYEECQIDPNCLSYLEAHATGTKVGDPEEINGMANIFCKNRKTPLLLGSIKSNLGHTEPTSGLCSIVKCIIAAETGYIPPNLSYVTPNSAIEELNNGLFEVVTEAIPFRDNNGLLAINNFGFGGANSHILLKRNNKIKIIDKCDNLPRLICASGRVEESVQLLLDELKSNLCDHEFVKLLHSLYRNNHNNHFHRGYSIINSSGEIRRSIKYFNNKCPKLHVIFGDLAYNWQTLGKSLHNLKIFQTTLLRIQKYVPELKVMEIFSKEVPELSTNILGNVIVQIGIVDIVKKLKLVPDRIYGYGLGEIVCAYYDQVITLEEIIKITLVIASVANKLENDKEVYLLTKTMDNMAPEFANNILATISDNLFITSGCNGTTSNNGIIAEEINLGLVNFHTEKFKHLNSHLNESLQKIINTPRMWNRKKSNLPIQSMEFSNKFNFHVPIENIVQQCNRNDVVLEIGCSDILAVLNLAACTKIETLPIISTNKEPNLVNFLETIGRLYELGFNVKLDVLYPKVDFPVGRGTPMISPSCKWNHKHCWATVKFQRDCQKGTAEKHFTVFDESTDWSFITGHVIDGRILYPATGYLELVREAFAQMKGFDSSNMKIVFENCKFHRATNVQTDNLINFVVMIHKGTGNFELLEKFTIIVSGKIYQVEIDNSEIITCTENIENESKLLTKDIYKELRLRGYNYKNSFKKLLECNASGTKGLIKWEGNYVTFIDNMMQLSLLNVDSRLLLVPTGIDKLVINGPLHATYTESIENAQIPVEINTVSGIIKSGGIEVHGLRCSSIARRIQTNPIIESYSFVPNVTNLDIKYSVRINIQLILENIPSLKVKVVEIEDTKAENYEYISPIINDVLKDIPLVKSEITILSKNNIQFEDIVVEDSPLSSKNDCNLIIVKNALTKHQILIEALKIGEFILCRESPDLQLETINEIKLGINSITVHKNESETFVLLTKLTSYKQPNIIVQPKNDDFSWLQNLQSAVKNNKTTILYAQNDSLSGILGLANCIKQEVGRQFLQIVFIADKKCQISDANDELVIQQLKKNLFINVYKNGQWGTYRHLPLRKIDEIEAKHCYVNNTISGNLSSLKWLEGHLNDGGNLKDGHSIVQVYYSALNFRDIMTASGKISNEVSSSDRFDHTCVLGFEFAGKDEHGNRVMGLMKNRALATMVEAPSHLQWNIPPNWTLAEGATVPVVYATCLYAFIVKGKIKSGESILIHSGTGGIGQAGIQLALHYGCKVYTTVGNAEKREFLKTIFPQLTDKEIFNSRNLTFEQNIMDATSGRGVDIVLNSLAEEKQIASVRCLARGGRFLEIGRFDLANNAQLNTLLLQKEISFHGIMLDSSFSKINNMATTIFELLNNAIKEGAVKPLNTTIFAIDKVEEAYRYMSKGIHTGKILIEIRKEEAQQICLPKNDLFKCYPTYYCDPEKSYIIIGGLGGFGLELADWLILRGAKNLVLSSRNGLQTGYQVFRTNIWKNYGVTVEISNADITTLRGCETLILEATKLGPVHGIFNLAVVLNDAILENQTIESFQKSFEPKALATKYLDILSRRICPHLRDFVVFSSVSCGRGNAGQSNYGMSNSVMERICEQRFQDGLPALAVQWGAIGDVGLVAEMQENITEIEIGGTLAQSIGNCLNILELLLKQKETSIASSIVIAEKQDNRSSKSATQTIAAILGIKNLKEISMHSTLAELGMDSITGVEVKQCLEREFEIFFAPSDIPKLTFSRIIEVQENKGENSSNMTIEETEDDNMSSILHMLLTELVDKRTNLDTVIKLESNIQENTTGQTVLLIPGIEGVGTTLNPLTRNLNANAVAFQIGMAKYDSVYDMALNLYPSILKHVTKTTPFIMVAHSFGTMISLELTALLEADNYKGHLVCIDGSPESMKLLFSGLLDVRSETSLQSSLIIRSLELGNIKIVDKDKERIIKCQNFEERIKLGQQIAKPKLNDRTSKFEIISGNVFGIYNRLKHLKNYQPTFNKLKSKITLIKPKIASVKQIEDDFKLSDFTDQQIEIREFEGNHMTVLNNLDLANYINMIVDENSVN